MPTLAHPRTITERSDRSQEAALRRIDALMEAEAAELAPDSWVRRHLEAHGPREWAASVVPELVILMGGPASPGDDPWLATREAPCPLGADEEAALRRLSALMRAEAAELGPGVPLARDLDRCALRLALEIEDPTRAPRLVC